MNKRIVTILLSVVTVLLIGSYLGFKVKEALVIKEVTVSNYDLGEYIFQEGEYDITSPIKGSIGVPKEENAPIVFIMHGSHIIDGDVNKPYAEGFEYLVEHLAKQGYLAISINVNRAYMSEPVEGNELVRIRKIFAENYRILKEAVEGKKHFGFSLKGKGDLSKINLIGHSRGGEHVLNIARADEFRHIPFVSGLLVAPTQNFRFIDSYADLPTAIIVPQYDTDVTIQDGVNYFYNAYFDDEARRNPIQYAYYFNADHNPFNANVNQKGLMEYQGVQYVEEEEQRNFLKGYATDFLDVYNKDKDYKEVFLNSTKDKYGTPYMPAYYFSEMLGRKLMRPSQEMLNIEFDKIDFQYMESSPILEATTSEKYNLPGSYHKIPLYKMSWDNKEGSLAWDLLAGMYNFYDYSGINILLGLDSSDERNSANRETAFELKITDVNGNEETVTLSSKDTDALHYVTGSVEDLGEGYEKWSHFTPLGSYVLPFDKLKIVNAKDGIQKIELIPASNTGSIVLGGIDFY